MDASVDKIASDRLLARVRRRALCGSAEVAKPVSLAAKTGPPTEGAISLILACGEGGNAWPTSVCWSDCAASRNRVVFNVLALTGSRTSRRTRGSSSESPPRWGASVARSVRFPSWALTVHQATAVTVIQRSIEDGER